MENDDNDLKGFSLPLHRGQSTDDRDEKAKPHLFHGPSRSSLEYLTAHRNTKLNFYAPSNYLMLGWQIASGGGVMPLNDFSVSSGSGAPPVVRELSENRAGRYHVFVGDLSPEVDDYVLKKAFSAFGTMSDARVMWDGNSGKSRGYGFLAFVDKTDAEQAIMIMNGKRLGSRKIRVNWTNQEIQRVSPTTTASSRRPVTSGSAPAASGFEHGRLLHDSLPLLSEPRNNRLGFPEGVETLDYRPDLAMSGSTDPSEGYPGTLFSKPDNSTLSPDTLPYLMTHHSDGFFGTLLSDPENGISFSDTPPKRNVATPKRIWASKARRKYPGRFACSMCSQTFTTNTNLKSKLCSADVAHELINIFQTMSMLTWALRTTVVIV